ncbi:MAG: hypothetical protein IBX55_01180 [Methyloprofundus sp.]|nr:hypothetical protein [Methyloprofundus sp.]
MKKFNFIFIWVFLLLSLSGCASNPMGLSDSEWSLLSTEEKIQARKQQAEIDLAKEIERNERLRIQKEAELREIEIMNARRDSASFGERVQCVLRGVYRDYQIEPTPLDMVIGMWDSSDMFYKRNSSVLNAGEVYGFFDGQTVSICSIKDTSLSRSNCSNIVGTTRDYKKGLNQAFSIRNISGRAYCTLTYNRHSR